VKVAIFTGIQPRHLALVEAVSAVADEVLAVHECKTLFPGRVDDLYPASSVMADYFAHVDAAEQAAFGPPRFGPAGVRQLILQRGDLNLLDADVLAPALAADVIIVFSGSFIRPPLVDRLIERQAINIHMGVSPYFRGMSCNFWALHEGHPEYVGATIHRLSAGLDSGAMLFHALPAAAGDSFALGMTAVAAAHAGIVEHLRQGDLLDLDPVPQDNSREIRYARGEDFTDDIAAAYLANPPSPKTIRSALEARDLGDFVRPHIA
jgi:folate-dependent phosphoribosylglycinamide formyltransferase PurN